MKFVLTKRRIILDFLTFLDLSCICVVCWKIVLCYIKYLENPQGTKISLEHSQNHQFPTMTFCFDDEEGSRWNTTHLKHCKIKG